MNDVNDKKKLTIFIAVLVIVLAVSFTIYNIYKDRVDPTTGEITSDVQTQSDVSTVSNFGQEMAVSNTPAPDFTMFDANGKAVKLSDFKGSPVVLNFWTSWCSYCKSEMPYFESAYKQYGDKVKFIMLNAVKSERNSEDGKNFMKESGNTFPVFYDTEGTASTLYQLRGFPATVFIDANGNIVEKNVGAISKEKLDENIKTLLGSH